MAEPPKTAVAVLCLGIATSYTAAALCGSHLQKVCGFTSAFLIQYLCDVFLTLCSVLALLLFACPSAQEWRRTVACQGPWVLLFAPLALGANVAFMLALRFTSTTSAVALEQLTSFFIAVMSYFVLKARYPLRSIPFLLMAVGGAMFATLGDAHNDASMVAGTNPLLGDGLTLMVAVLASLYMVLFKFIFQSMTQQEFMIFCTLKGGFTTAFGWMGVLVFSAVGWEQIAWPRGSCMTTWLSAKLVTSVLFNWSLSWTTLRISPLTARLSLLLGIPCSFLVSLLLGDRPSIASIGGVLLIFVGVVGFEVISKRKVASTSQEEVDLPENCGHMSQPGKPSHVV